jgi:DNA-binding NarL/FixJ family response regulator
MHIILADSNEIIRLGLRAIISSNSSWKIVGEAKNNEELQEIIESFGEAVVLIDYSANGFDISIIPKILSSNKNVKFVAVTPEQSAQTLVDALRSGVTSYVKKDCEISEIVNSLEETFNGNKFFCGQILETIQRANIDVNDIDFDSFTCESVVLSERENEIIKLIAEGNTNPQIADQLFLSSHTVNTHRKNIMGKLGVRNTAGIVMYAVKTNLVSPNKFLFAPELDN